MAFTFLPDDEADDTSGGMFCPVCNVHRAEESIEDGICVFCDTFIAPTDDEELPGLEKKPLAPITKPEKRLENEKAAFDMPYDRPTAVIDAHIERELANRMLCRRRLMPFIKKFRPKYNAGWVHEDICRRLERFVRDVEQGNEPRMLLMMPPR